MSCRTSEDGIGIAGGVNVSMDVLNVLERVWV